MTINVEDRLRRDLGPVADLLATSGSDDVVSPSSSREATQSSRNAVPSRVEVPVNLTAPIAIATTPQIPSWCVAVPTRGSMEV